MKPLPLGLVVGAALLGAACDVFIDDSDVGHEGQPCAAANGACFGDLVCLEDTCVPPPGVGEACSFDSVEDLCDDLACEAGLWCVESGTSYPYAYTCMAIGGPGEPCICQDEHGDCAYRICEAFDWEYGQASCEQGLACLNGTCG